MYEMSVDHSRDVERMEEIDRYQLLDHVPRPELTAFADLAARVCGVSSAFISVITDTELLQLATVGFESFSVPRAVSMCDAVLAEDEPLVSADLTTDPRFRDNPHVRAGRAVFYASYQLTAPSGVPFGSLCVFDDEGREIDDSQRRALRDLADRVVDVLELAVRNRELASTVAELERSNQQLAAFAGQISHDLRNPLGAMSTTLELLSELAEDTATSAPTSAPTSAQTSARTPSEPDDDLMQQLIFRARRSTTRMARLVEEVLEFATLGGRLDPHVVDVHKLLLDVCDDLHAELTRSTLEVGHLEDVMADPVQLRIVVQNLLSNAVKYAVPGQAPQIEVSAHANGSTWRLAVVDHGRGVDAEDRERVFEPFVRVSGADTGGLPIDAVDGTGMGLATCQRIISAHGGRIGLDPTPGGGTTAWLELPAALPER